MSLDQKRAAVLTIDCNNNCFYLCLQCGMFGLDRCVLVHLDQRTAHDN